MLEVRNALRNPEIYWFKKYDISKKSSKKNLFFCNNRWKCCTQPQIWAHTVYQYNHVHKKVFGREEHSDEHVRLFVCTRAWGLLTVAQAKTISLLVGSAPKAPRKFWDIWPRLLRIFFIFVRFLRIKSIKMSAPKAHSSWNVHFRALKWEIVVQMAINPC